MNTQLYIKSYGKVNCKYLHEMRQWDTRGRYQGHKTGTRMNIQSRVVFNVKLVNLCTFAENNIKVVELYIAFIYTNFYDVLVYFCSL